MSSQELHALERLVESVKAANAVCAFKLLNEHMVSISGDINDATFDLIKFALSHKLTEAQILDFHSKWGGGLKESVYSQAYMRLLTSYNGLEFIDESRNVVVGRDGYLYLAGGRHSVLDYITGRKCPANESFDNFRGNLKRRERFCAERGIVYRHVIYPDKQSVEVDNFPLGGYTCLGDQYVAKCLDLESLLLYPRLELGAGSFHKKDTHMSDRGYCILTSLLLRKLGFSLSVCEQIKEELLGLLSKKVKYSGDLGSKMSPEEFDVKNDIEACWNYRYVKNNLGVSNDGLAELYFNEDALTGMRVVIFGDSFSRLHSLFLSRCFREVAFYRTRYFHEDIVEMAKPDLVITGNAERYLSAVENDNLAPNFFLYPLLKGIGHAPDQEYAVAMNAFLSYGKPEYEKYKDKVRLGL